MKGLAMNKFRLKTIAQLILGGLVMTNTMSHAFAYDLGTVSSSAGDATAAASDTAPYQAPTQGSLVSTEPQSVIGEQYIRNNLSGAANYNDIASIAPGVVNVSPNGVGASDGGGLFVRGFQDGQYNVTFDGIPFADGADFTHHANSFFMGQDIGKEVVDRGPGNASTIGDATFGGTIAMHSKDPGTNPALTPSLSTGSFNTHLAGVELDTGVMQNFDDFSGFIDYNNYSTDGALTNNSSARSNLFAKFVKPISAETAITFVTMQNTTTQHASLGATASQIAQYGPTFGLTADPTSQAFVGYNQDKFTSDFEYVGVQTQQGDWKMDNKLYTFAYEHDGIQGADPSGVGANGTNVGTTSVGITSYPSNVPGITALTQYRSYGDVFNATKTIGLSDLKFGMWIDQQQHQSWNNNVDLTLGGALQNPGLTNAEQSSDTTFQPYVQYAWRPNTDLTVTPGVKYNSFSRYYNASLDSGANAPVNYSKTWTAVLPSLDAHYFVAENWSVYAQAAEGFLAPALSNIQGTTTPGQAVSNLKPSNTVNYQAGSTWKSDKLTLSGDVYFINNDNLIQQGAINPNGVQTYINSGSSQFKGVESEATYVVGSGFSLYGNLTFSSYSAAIAVTNAPSSTAAAGLIYSNGQANSDGAFYSSLIMKEVGPRYSGTTDANGNAVYFSGYAVTNFSAGYNFTKQTKLQLNVNNIFNNTDTIMWSNAYADPNGANNDPLFYTNVGRNFMLTLTTGL